MGLDMALGVLVLISAIRGWLKGFLVQAIRLAGLVIAVYVALPIRDQVKPYAVEYLSSIPPLYMDRILWWGSAVVSYVVITGVASLTLAITRRQSFGIEDPRRGDQFAGLGFGLLKGLLAASFLVASVAKHATPHIDKIAWLNEQTKTSMAWQWNEQYKPAGRIWNSPPVQQFIAHVQKMGISGPTDEKEPAPVATPVTAPAPEPEKPVQTASRTPNMIIASGGEYHPPHRPKFELKKYPRRTYGRKSNSTVTASASYGNQGPDINTDGLDSETQGTVQSILQKLSGLGGLGGMGDLGGLSGEPE